MQHSLKSIAVFCGSSSGFDEQYVSAAYSVGQSIASRHARVIYGGAQIGLMGAVADGALLAGGDVIGVIPFFLRTKEVAHTGLTGLIVVDNMHERKLRMHELSDAIIVLPGGWGTMEEVMEMLTWAQLGLHAKPIGLLNIGGFYNGLLLLIDTMVAEGFLKQVHADMLIVGDSIEKLFTAMETYSAPPLPKWITEEET